MTAPQNTEVQGLTADEIREAAVTRLRAYQEQGHLSDETEQTREDFSEMLADLEDPEETPFSEESYDRELLHVLAALLGVRVVEG